MDFSPYVVLLLEDSYDDQRLVLRALRNCRIPILVKVAHDGEAGLQALGLTSSDKNRKIPDLIISDLKMPKLNGDEVLRIARREERLQDVPYVIFSSSSESSGVEKCMALGASEYCMKPVPYEEYTSCVVEIVRKWLSESDADRRPPCEIASEERTPVLAT